MAHNSLPIYSISISGLLSWQLHALNNEGNEGNQSLTRRYYVISKNDAEPQYVNGISGDMLKHIQAEHLHRIALESSLNLSEGGKRFDPDRIGYDLSHEDKNHPFFSAKETDLIQRTQKVLKTCSLSDLEGFMVTIKGGQTLKRDSVIEFGTVVGIPGSVKTQSYFHAKYGVENPTPYNVQVNSGLYATVLNIEAFRIGYNPHNFSYAIDITERKQRLDALLKSVLYTYLQPNGAKRNTHLPHPDRFEGVITVSTKRCPAPMISSLQIDSFQRQIDHLATTLNRINGAGTIHQYPFEDFAEFAAQIETLIQQAQPWESDYAEAIG
jgi:CRISPR-associated protein Cst2